MCPGRTGDGTLGVEGEGASTVVLGQCSAMGKRLGQGAGLRPAASRGESLSLELPGAGVTA